MLVSRCPSVAAPVPGLYFNPATVASEKEECFRMFYANAALVRRILGCIFHLRNPILPLFSNLSYRANTLRLDRSDFKDFDMSPGDTTMHGTSELQR